MEVFLDFLYRCDMVAAAQHVLTAVFQPDVEAFATVGVIAEVLSDHDVAEIAPITEHSSAPA